MRFLRAVYKDQLPGGVGDDKTPEDFDEDDVKEGAEHELEHTFDPDVATEIAIDHLTEDPDYYKTKKISGNYLAKALKRVESL